MKKEEYALHSPFAFYLLPFALYYLPALPEMRFHLKGDAMRTSQRLCLSLLLLAGTLILTACPQQTSVSKIMADPARYRNKEVSIAGTVTDSYGILGQGAYEIDDGTGRLWVATTRGVPSRGARIGVKGHILSGFNVGGRSFGTVLEESGRSTKGR